MKTMSTAQIARLNAELYARLESDDKELDAGCVLANVARDNNLEVIREDPSGNLYQAPNGLYVFGWTEGTEVEFDDQI